MRYELKSIPYWAFIKIAFFINLIGGFIFGFFYAVFFSLFISVLQNIPAMYEFDNLGIETAPMGFMIIILPIFIGFFSAFFNTII